MEKKAYIPDLKGIVGDISDNIPGVRGLKCGGTFDYGIRRTGGIYDSIDDSKDGKDKKKLSIYWKESPEIKRSSYKKSGFLNPDYIKANLGAAPEVIRHGGNLPDLDNIIHLEGLLHTYVSGDSILEINEPQSLMRFLTMYVTNVPVINL